MSASTVPTAVGRRAVPAVATSLASLDVDSTGKSKVAVLPWTSTMGGAALGIGMILLGCCANVWTLEVITKRDAGAGNLITFAQFLLIASQGLINHWRWPFGLVPRVVPLSIYAKITSIFFLTSLLNNAALDYHISIPVHTVFRSSGLTATLLLGRFFYRTHYPAHQVLACMLVSVGILSVTLADVGRGRPAPSPSSCCGDALASGNGSSAVVAQHNATGSGIESDGTILAAAAGWSTNSVWMVGILMLSTALFLAAYLGHEQDRAYKRFGKGTWREVMFYSHLFSMPAFLFVGRDIVHHFHLLASLPPSALPLPYLGLTFHPSLLLMLLLNLVFQLVCIRGVYMLTTHTNTLTCSLVLTFRKLLSLLLSVTYFGNSFTLHQWLGTAMVFVGVVVYSHGNPFTADNWKMLIKSPEGSRVQSRAATPEMVKRTVEGGEREVAEGMRRRVAKAESNGVG